MGRRATSVMVIVHSPAFDTSLRLVADEADQTVWLVPVPAEPRPSVRVAATAMAPADAVVNRGGASAGIHGPLEHPGWGGAAGGGSPGAGPAPEDSGA